MYSLLHHRTAVCQYPDKDLADWGDNIPTKIGSYCTVRGSGGAHPRNGLTLLRHCTMVLAVCEAASLGENLGWRAFSSSLHGREGVSSARPVTRLPRRARGHAVAHVVWALADIGRKPTGNGCTNCSLPDRGIGGKWQDDAQRSHMWGSDGEAKREASSKSNEHHRTGTNRKKRGPRPANRRYVISSVSLAEPNSPCHILVWRSLLSAVALIRTAHARAGGGWLGWIIH